MFCNCILVRFKLKLEYELFKLGLRGLQIYPRVLGVCPKQSLYGYPQGICGLKWSLWGCVRNAPVRVWQRSAPRGHFSVGSCFLWVFCHRKGLIEVLDFHLMVVNWGRWVLIILVTQIILIQLDWSDEPQPSAEHTHWSLVNFNKF